MVIAALGADSFDEASFFMAVAPILRRAKRKAL